MQYYSVMEHVVNKHI